MILTLTWKELREHQGIWLTMVLMTVGIGTGLVRMIALGAPGELFTVSVLTILGLGATYGVVCGAMMIAGEQEGGTLVFLDIFCGRRGLLWFGKFAIGTVLVLTESLAVAMLLTFVEHHPPRWIMALVGFEAGNLPAGALTAANRWFFVLPMVALESYAWGLLGSSLTKRVLSGAAVAAICFAPVGLFANAVPVHAYFWIRLLLALLALGFSLANFVRRSGDGAAAPPPDPDLTLDPKQDFLELWDELESEDIASGRSGRVLSTEPMVSSSTIADDDDRGVTLFDGVPGRREPEPVQASSSNEVLWWLTYRQALPLVWVLAGMALLAGLAMPANAQVLWPLATLLIGVTCGVAAFGAEQGDQSHQFLAAQHFPLHTIWRFKILFWFTVAMLAAAIMLVVATLSLDLLPNRQRGRIALTGGTLPELIGRSLFVGVWLVYGFCTGQVCVWLCRKNILALLISTLTAAGTLSLWLPSLLCGGMTGWPVWVPPLVMLLATWLLMRAWASGRIKERKPVLALASFAAGVMVLALLQYGQRAWECPDAGMPIDPPEFKSSVHGVTKKFEEALAEFDVNKDAKQENWLALIAEAAREQPGTFELPRSTGQPAGLKHLPICKSMCDTLVKKAAQEEPVVAFRHLAQVLAISRSLRCKAAPESYLAGIDAEKLALDGLDALLARGKPAPGLLNDVLKELDRHAAETPTALDCLQTECYRSNGAVDNPTLWTFAALGAPDALPERWLAGSIALSLEMPWEAERKTRIWQLVWAGLFESINTPYWRLPRVEALPADKIATRKILRDWLAPRDGPGASMTREQLAGLLDTSWLADERLFCPVGPLRDAANRSRWHVDVARLTVALSLHRMDKGKPADTLKDLEPRYFPGGLPIDPYSGQSYSYRVDPAGREIVWSVGPDKIDNGGHKDGTPIPDDSPRWQTDGLDLIKAVPRWPG
jgi:hypothetical protein